MCESNKCREHASNSQRNSISREFYDQVACVFRQGLAAKNPNSAISFEDFYQFQMLVVYDLAEVERALRLFRSDSRRFGRKEFTRAVKAARRYALLATCYLLVATCQGPPCQRATLVTNNLLCVTRSKTTLSPALLDALWAVLDKSGDGQIEFTDFCTSVLKHPPPHHLISDDVSERWLGITGHCSAGGRSIRAAVKGRSGGASCAAGGASCRQCSQTSDLETPHPLWSYLTDMSV